MDTKNLVDPVRIVDDLKRRSQQGYTGEKIEKWKDGEIINIREKYSIEIPLANLLEQWNECFKHFSGLSEAFNISGKIFISLFKGGVTKFDVERSLPMEKFWYYEKK